jgi:hypothetical protein
MIKSLARIPSLLLLLTTLGFLACQQTNEPAPATPTETVSGIIQDEDGLALPEAVVEAVNAQSTILAADTADEDGRFALSLPVDLTGIKIRITRDDLKPFEREIREFVDRAGGKSGIILNGDHEDSCCGVISLVVTGLNEELGNVEVKLRKNGNLISKSYTNSDGRVTFRHICEGEYNLRIAKEGWVVQEPDVTVGDDCDSVFHTVELQSNGHHEEDSCCGSAVNFTIKDSATQQILEGVQIKLQKGDHKIIKNVENGGASFNELCEGVYAVRIAKDGYKVMEFSLEVGCDTETNLTKFIASMGQNNHEDSCCNGLIKIFAKNSGGEILTGAKVRLWKGGSNIRTETMSSGGVTFRELCEGNYGISINAEGYNGVEWEFELGCNDTLETITKTLTPKETHNDSCCNGVLFVVLKEDGTNTRIANATVKLYKGSTLHKTATTNGDGVAKFTGICPGEYSASLIREGYAHKEFGDIIFECNDTLEFTKTLVKNANTECCTAALKLRIKDSTNMVLLEGATVKIYKEGQLVATVSSNSEGWALKEQLCGYTTYTVVVEKDGYHSKEMHFTYTECKTLQETVWLIQE